jgi:trans-AT polyketide synthase, acyltransferase and oxidoreductase domains
VHERTNDCSRPDGILEEVAFDPAEIKTCLLKLNQPCYLIGANGRLGATNTRSLAASRAKHRSVLLMALSPSLSTGLGSSKFRAFYGVKYAYVCGAMANGIASEQLVITLGKQGILSSFGAAGLSPERIEQAIYTIQKALPSEPYAFNLIHTEGENSLEQKTAELYIKHNIPTIEASAFLNITSAIVQYRATGLRMNRRGQIEIGHKIIAKVSRKEVAAQFLHPAPPHMLRELVEHNLISEQQANMAAIVPLADDLTVEADSAGHTDNQSLVCLLPSIINLRDDIQSGRKNNRLVRIGVGGGIGTPYAAFAAFMMGADYIVTGSINQACVESHTSPYTKHLLSTASMNDVMMAPSADMFEMGIKVQLLKKGTLYPMRAQRLYELYKAYDSLDDISMAEREQLERDVFRQSIDMIWQETKNYFAERDPRQLTRAAGNAKHKMALVFRWYLGMSSRWAIQGQVEREMDYQIWCGPAMGAFNDWVRNSYLAEPQRRSVVDIAYHIMIGAAYLYRLQDIRQHGFRLPAYYHRYQPVPFTIDE